MTNNHYYDLFDTLGNIMSASVCNYKMCVTIMYNGSPGARIYMRTRAALSLPCMRNARASNHDVRGSALTIIKM